MFAKDLCKHIHSELAPHHHLTRIHPEDEDTPILSIPFDVTWRGAWLEDSDLLQLPHGKSALETYALNKVSLSKEKRTAPSAPPLRTGGWRPKHTTFTTIPINPDLDAIPTGTYKITHHPTSQSEALLYAPDGRLITKLTKARLQKLKSMCTPANYDGTFPHNVAEMFLRHKAVAYDPTLAKLHNLYKKNSVISRNPTEHGPY